MTLHSTAPNGQAGIAMTTKCLTTILTGALLGGALLAQTPKAKALLTALGANGRQMASYQWKQRTTVSRNGRQAGFRLEEVRFDAGGPPQRVTLSPSEQKRMGPLRAH